ncbi:MAG: hypothetical protein ACLGHX_12295 [Acidimicrobiia bacterium]
MRIRIRIVVLGAALAALLGMSLAAQAAPTKATCSDVGFLGIVVHGHHVVRDYVAGEPFEWPPAGQVDASGGAAIPGGSGRGHLGAGVAPGASFCTDSNSPGVHL